MLVSVVRELSEQEKSDLMIVSKNGWLTVNGKKSFVVLHTGQLCNKLIIKLFFFTPFVNN